MKRYALIVALVMALAASIGCAKKTTTEPAYEQNTGVNPALQSAVQTIPAYILPSTNIILKASMTQC